MANQEHQWKAIKILKAWKKGGNDGLAWWTTLERIFGRKKEKKQKEGGGKKHIHSSRHLEKKREDFFSFWRRSRFWKRNWRVVQGFGEETHQECISLLPFDTTCSSLFDGR
ncbi:hypothetical protein V8G54_008063 [Vigna mungo]|uniref:Uncharacterized protein n=1 Tax=Vigna mungo TaxID=3915 RepID=A0AAQ3P2F6_VIGMU